MSISKILLIVCTLACMSSALARADDCGPRDINGKKYTCCKKSVTNTGKLACDAKGKPGETMKCGEKIETTYECTEVVQDKKK